VTERIRGRAAFARFRTDGRRFRHDPLWLSWVPDDAAVPPRVAYAVGRAVGRAVTRNQVRRRLRALVAAECHRGLPAGWYLVGATPRAAAARFEELGAALGGLAGRVRAEAQR
jgi:ribonuclease P protein component